MLQLKQIIRKFHRYAKLFSILKIERFFIYFYCFLNFNSRGEKEVPSFDMKFNLNCRNISSIKRQIIMTMNDID